MSRPLSLRDRWQWLVAFLAVVVVVYLVAPLWVTVIAAALVLAFGLPPLLRRKRHRARR
jgi:predicted PurR-regulated permease PerM